MPSDALFGRSAAADHRGVESAGPFRLTIGDQSGRTLAPIKPHWVQTIFGSNHLMS